MQTLYKGRGCVGRLNDCLAALGVKRPMLVSDSSYPYLNIKTEIDAIPLPVVSFSDFTPNPQYTDVVKGVELFRSEGCDAVVAVGGGSSLDVAKCIKLFSRMSSEEVYLKQPYGETGIPLIAIPTTAGTGSESTRYAVIYYEGAKQSVTHDSIVPNIVFLDASVLKTLPLYQKKCTLLDALCQGIESYWSVNSTEESRVYSEEAIRTIMAHYRSYIRDNDDAAAEEIMAASNAAGRAINITQTTAAHAMSYKITSMYRLPHGHAVAVCLPHIWRYMCGHMEACTDPRGDVYLQEIFERISAALGCRSAEEAIARFEALLAELDMQYPIASHQEDLHTLTAAVNVTRLGNNPVRLTEDTLYRLYQTIVKTEN